jgi:peroxiredoxin
VTARGQWIAVGAVVALLAGGAVVATRVLGDEIFPVAIGQPAPPFTAVPVDAADGAPRTLADYRGQVVVVNIWATWCLPCRAEMPSLERLHQAYKDRGLKVVAVSVDQPGMTDAIRAFATDYRLTFDILHDAPGTIQRDYQTTGVPETFVIGRDGTIRRREIGGHEWAGPDVRALVERLLTEPGA